MATLFKMWRSSVVYGLHDCRICSLHRTIIKTKVQLTLSIKIGKIASRLKLVGNQSRSNSLMAPKFTDEQAFMETVRQLKIPVESMDLTIYSLVFDGHQMDRSDIEPMPQERPAPSI